MTRIRHEEPPAKGKEGLTELESEPVVNHDSVNLLDAQASEDDREDRAKKAAHIRPQNFGEYIGQEALVHKLKVYVAAAMQRKEPLDHVLLHGPPGLGKTTLAQIIAEEMGGRLITTSGPAIEHKGVLAGLLTALETNEVLFIDEIHRLSPTVEESLYSAMEDGKLDISMGEGSRASTMSIALAPFTLIGATTRTALLTAPLRDRFHIVEGLEFYQDHELASIVRRTAEILGLPASEKGALEIGRRSRGTPRIANRLTRRVRDFIQVAGQQKIEAKYASRFLDQLQVDQEGLNVMDQRMLETILSVFDGGPVGIEALAASLGVPRDTLEDVHEPFLLQRGFLVRTPRGRMTTSKAIRHLSWDSAKPD